jgi:hypothetical protein
MVVDTKVAITDDQGSFGQKKFSVIIEILKTTRD